MKIGFGYDVHRFAENRSLVLGGVTIPYEYGLLGHSDADVLIHALMDSLLGACALGDIGTHFPDTDSAYKNIDSMLLLRKVAIMIKNEGYCLGNADITVVAQKPKISPYYKQIRCNIADALHTDINNINVKATTEEGLGFSGRLEGIKCYSVCLLQNSEEHHEII